LNLLFYFTGTATDPQGAPLAGCIALDVRTIAQGKDGRLTGKSVSFEQEKR
jgi:uncharacterized OsmC-like protein